MTYLLLFNTKGFSDYIYWQSQDKKITKRINDLIKSIQRDGVLSGIGKPEALKGDLKGSFSRRIDDKNRLVYKMTSNNEIKGTLIISCAEHYPKLRNQQEKLKLAEGIHIF